MTPETTKDRQRAQIAAQVEAYLSSGKEIEEVDHTANHEYLQPTKRSRREQITYQKRTQKIRIKR